MGADVAPVEGAPAGQSTPPGGMGKPQGLAATPDGWRPMVWRPPGAPEVGRPVLYGIAEVARRMMAAERARLAAPPPARPAGHRARRS